MSSDWGKASEEFRRAAARDGGIEQEISSGADFVEQKLERKPFETLLETVVEQEMFENTHSRVNVWTLRII